MACNKKVFTYGSKKEPKESKSWTGALKGDVFNNEQSSKRLSKKSVWAKAPGKSVHKLNNNKTKCNEPDDPFDFVDDNNKTIFSPGLEKPKMPTSSFYGSRMDGKGLSQPSVTIGAKELNLFGSPKKKIGDMIGMIGKTTTEGSKCVSSKDDTKESKIDNEKDSKIKCDDLNDKKKTNIQKTEPDKDGTLKKCVSPSKAKVTNIPNKTKPINIKPVVRITKLNGENCKGLEKARELIECRPVKPQLKCGNIPVQFIDDNTVLVITQNEDRKAAKTNKKKTKTQKTQSDKNTPVKKSRLKEDIEVFEDDNIFNILNNENDRLSEEHRTPEKNHVEKQTLSKTTKRQNRSLAIGENDKVENDDKCTFSDIDDDDLSENELEKNIPLLEDVEEDDIPLKILCKTPVKVLKDNLHKSPEDIEDELPLQRLCKSPEEIEEELPLQRLCKSPEEIEEELPLQQLCKSPLKRTVSRKRSLFSYYDKAGNKPSSASSDILKDFDFTSEPDEDGMNVDEKAEDNTDLSADEHSNDIDIAPPASKKNKVDDLSQGSQQQQQQQQLEDQGSSNNAVVKMPYSNSNMKSPFKSKKPPSGLRQLKSDRRFSSLPTDVTLESDDIDDDYSEEVINTPPPLYRSSIFGFRKSVGASDHKVRVRRDEKELYTVVRNTRNAHECLEYGQSQQFKDDLDYLMDGLKSTHNISTRCLSALELASKCTLMEFRMHIKAHGLIENMFTVLEDAFSDEQLLLCASMIMYVLAKDKLKINFDKKTIGFMLQVVTKKREDSTKSQPNKKMMKKIRTIFEKLEDVDIDIETLDATALAREALLSLTVKRTGEWFKDEIRELGGLDDVADTVYSCCQCIQKRENLDKSCVRMKRCLTLFSDMSYKSTANQVYLLTCRNSVVIESCIRTIYIITTNLEKEIPTVIADCLMSIQLLLMNLSHENKTACIKICKQENGLDSILRSALHLSRYLPENMAYENTIVSLCLMINLTADHPQNKMLLNKKLTIGYSGIQAPTTTTTTTSKKCEGKLVKPVEALMQMFLIHSEACKEADLMQELEKLEREESEQEAAMHYQEDEDGLTCGDKFEDTVDEEDVENPSTSEPKNDTDGPLNETEKQDIRSTLDKAQRHMEDSHLSAYTGLLIGLLMEEDPDNQELAHSLLPDGDFIVLEDSIEKIISFMEMTNPLSKSDQDCMKRIIQVIHTCNDKFKEKG